MPVIILSDVQVPFGAGSGKVLTSDGDGNATWQALTAHAVTHAIGGTDPLTPGAIGAATVTSFDAHAADTTAIHGIADTAALVLTGDSRLTDQRVPTDLSVTSGKLASGLTLAGQTQIPAGTLATPSLAFTTSPNTGLYSSGVGTINVAISGVSRMSLNASALILAASFLGTAGNAGAPGISFSGDSNTGLYSGGADIIGFATGGVARATLNATGQLGFIGADGMIRPEGNPDANKLEIHATKLNVANLNSQTYADNATINTAIMNLCAQGDNVEAFRFRVGTTTTTPAIQFKSAVLSAKTFTASFYQDLFPQLFLNSNGRIGMGTITPTGRLTVRQPVAGVDELFRWEDAAGVKLGAIQADGSIDGLKVKSPDTLSTRTIGVGNNGFLSDGVNSYSTHLYTQSRLQNLITNGSGLLGNNYNFTTFIFDQVEVHGGGGSFKLNIIQNARFSDELIPVDTEKVYRLTGWAKAGDADGSNYTNPNTQYLGVAPYDIDGILITTYAYQKSAGSTDTTLAVALEPGNTTMTLSDATGWYNGASAGSRIFAWWPYTNAKGYTYPDYTYSRNFKTSAWAEGGVSGNVITLAAPWAGPSLPVGTPVRNTVSGGTYKYIAAAGQNVPAIWKRYSGVIGPVDLTGSGATGLFPYGTAFVRILFLINYHGVADSIRWSDLTFGEEVVVPVDSVTNVSVSATAAIAESKLALASDAAAGTPSRRTLGTGALQAAAGDDARFSDQRIPTDLSVTNAKVSATAAIAKSKLEALDIVDADVAVGAAIAKSKLAALSIVDADISAGAAIAYSKLALTGSVVAGDLAANAITTVKIVDLNVTTAKLANDAVTDAKLADASVGADQLQDGAVVGTKIGDSQVGTTKLTNLAVTNGKIADGAVSAPKFGQFLQVVNQQSTNSSWAILLDQLSAANGARYLILARSNTVGTADTEFYVLDNGEVRADGSIVGGGADYAEWLAHDAGAVLVNGDVVGLNLSSGKVRKLQAGDPMVGVVSENPAFSAGNPLPMSERGRPGGYALVGLIGRIEIQPRQVEVIDGVVFALANGKRLGYMLADGRTFLDIDKTS